MTGASTESPAGKTMGVDGAWDNGRGTRIDPERLWSSISRHAIHAHSYTGLMGEAPSPLRPAAIVFSRILDMGLALTLIVRFGT